MKEELRVDHLLFGSRSKELKSRLRRMNRRSRREAKMELLRMVPETEEDDEFLLDIQSYYSFELLAA